MQKRHGIATPLVPVIAFMPVGCYSNEPVFFVLLFRFGICLGCWQLQLDRLRVRDGELQRRACAVCKLEACAPAVAHVVRDLSKQGYRQA